MTKPKFTTVGVPTYPVSIFIAAQNIFEAETIEGLKQQSYTIQAPDKTVWFSHRDADQ